MKKNTNSLAGPLTLSFRSVRLTPFNAQFDQTETTRPVTNGKDNRSPYAEAMEWVSRIVAVAIIMVLPGLAGHWLDGRLGTKFMALVGFVFGVTGGIGYLLAMTKPPRPPGGSSESKSDGK